MKFSIALAGVLSTLALAAPSSRSLKNNTSIDTGALNGLVFAQLDLKYLQGVNELDLILFQKLGISNNLDVLIFQELFNSQVLDVQTLLKFQQLSTLLAIAGSGAFKKKFDLNDLKLGALDLKLVQAIGAVELVQFVDVALAPQIHVIADRVMTVIIQ